MKSMKKVSTKKPMGKPAGEASMSPMMAAKKKMAKKKPAMKGYMK